MVVILPIPILVLLIACVNAANLMTARGVAAAARDRHPPGDRRGAGTRHPAAARRERAPRARRNGDRAANRHVGDAVRQHADRRADPSRRHSLVLTIAAAALTTVAFGLAPAVRVSAQRPSSTLGATGARTDGRPGESRTRRVLVMAQVALSLGLLTTAWQLVATVRGEAVAAGTAPDRLLLARFDLRPLGFTAADAESFYRELVAGARRLPGVEAADVARGSSVWTFGNTAEANAVTVWRESDRMEDGQAVSGGYAGPDLFTAVGLRIIAGRGFTDADRQSRPQIAVVNETAARNLNGPAVGGAVERGHARPAI